MVLVGTPYTPEATRRLLDWARSRYGERRIVAVNNGFHVDNLGGNSALRDANIPVYGSDLTVRLLHERGEKTRQHILEMIGNRAAPDYAVHARIPYVPPDHVFPITRGLVLRRCRSSIPGRVRHPTRWLSSSRHVVCCMVAA